MVNGLTNDIVEYPGVRILAQRLHGEQVFPNCIYCCGEHGAGHLSAFHGRAAGDALALASKAAGNGPASDLLRRQWGVFAALAGRCSSASRRSEPNATSFDMTFLGGQPLSVTTTSALKIQLSDAQQRG
jgi:hypothetical protein